VAFAQIATFARSADGNVAPTRRIAGQATLISRAAHDIVYDPVNDEILVANPFAQAIVVHRGGANGDEAPIRVLVGPKTGLMHPDYAIFVDAVHDELYVTEKEQISVFPRTAHGDVAPLRVIKGPDTGLVNLRGFVMDPVRNLLVASAQGGLHIFNRTDNGNVKPRAIIAGPKSGIRSTIQNIRYVQEKGWIVAVSGGRGEDGGEEGGGGGRRGSEESAEEGRGGGGGGTMGGQIRVWSVMDSGDAPPLFVLRNPKGAIRGSRIALNPKGKEVLIGSGTKGIEVYFFPEIF